MTLALAVGAAPVYLIDATTDGIAPDASLSNVGFSLTHEDFNFDTLFSLNELIAFTGVFDSTKQYFDPLLGTPTALGVTGTGAGWLFGDRNGLLANFSTPAGAFTPFSTELLAGSVPEPGALVLALAAFAALGVTRRSSRKTAA